MNITKEENELVKMIGKTAKLRRLQKNISQEKLAENCGISLASITRFETGRGNISLQNLLAILKALDMTDSFKALFANENEENSQSTGNERVKWSKKRKLETPAEL
jgi:transcriptional regulator with XRE-family HTH domain